MDAHFRTGTLHSAKDRHWSDQNIHNQTAYDNNCLCNGAEFFYVIDRLILAAGAKTLAYDGHQAHTYSDGRDTIQVLKDIGHCLRCDGCCSQCGNRRLDGKLSKLKHTVLNSRRDPKSQDTSDHAPVRTDLQVIFHNDRLTILTQLPENNHCTENTGNQCGDRRSCNTKVENPDQNRVSANVHDIGDHGDGHRPLGILLGTKDRSRRIISRNKGE